MTQHPASLAQIAAADPSVNVWLVANAAWPFKGPKAPMRAEPMYVNFGGSTPEPKAYMVVLVTTLNRLILGLSAASAVGEGALRYTSIEYSVSAAARSSGRAKTASSTTLCPARSTRSARAMEAA